MCAWVIKKEEEIFDFSSLGQLPVVQTNGFAKGEVLSAEASKTFFRIHGRLPTTGEIGCSRAHLKAYQYLCASTYESMLILESDAVLRNDPMPALQEIANTAKGDSWIVDLEPRIIGKSFKLLGGCSEDLKKLPLPDFGTTGYVISKHAASLILSDQSPEVFWLADWPPSVGRLIEFYSLCEGIVLHPVGNSSIGRPQRKPSFRSFVSRIWASSSYSMRPYRGYIVRDVLVRELAVFIFERLFRGKGC